MSPAKIEAEMAYAAETFRFTESGLFALLHAPDSPVIRDLTKRAIRVEAAAKSNWSISPSAPGSKPGVVTGLLRGSITWRIGADAFSPYADVGSAVFYAPFLELGTSMMSPRPYLRPALEAARIP